MKVRGVLYDFIPDVQKLTFSYILYEGWVIDPDVNGLLNGPSDAMCLTAYYSESLYTDRMLYGPAVLIDGRRSHRLWA